MCRLKEIKIKCLMIIFVLVTGLYQWQLVVRLKHSYQRKHTQDTTCVNKQFVYHKKGYANNDSDDSKKIETFIQDQLYDLQNPQNCASSQKVVCALPPSLYNTKNIQVIKAVYETFYFDLERTLPADFRRDIKRFHSDPQLWWAGQLASYILRPTDRLSFLIAEKKQLIGFTNPIVGLHIRRTDKLSEANYYNITEYMKAAENWFDEYENKSKVTGNKRKIFLATDEPKVVEEAKKMFPDYIFINDINVTTDANKRGKRYRYSSLVGIVIDTFLLSMCDYIVCTMTSNICRLAFELMQPRYKDASTYAKSLDCDYFIQKLYKRHCRIRPTKLSAVEKMIKNVI